MVKWLGLQDTLQLLYAACFCFGEEENASGSREKKKLRRTGNSSWLVCATGLDCSHLLLIVAIGNVHAMLATQCKARPTMVCIRLADYAIML